MSYSGCPSGCPRGHVIGSKECTISHGDSPLIKNAALKVSNSIVAVLTYGFPDDMLCDSGTSFPYSPSFADEDEPVFNGSGLIIACEKDSNIDELYYTTILTAATMFKRTSNVLPDKIKVDVYFHGGVRFSAEVTCCDFHYNLAAIRVQTNFPSQVATLMRLDDSILSNPNELLRVQHQPFQLRRHPDAMKILPRELVIAIGRFHLDGDHTLKITPVFFSEKLFREDCPEVYGLYCCSSSELSDHGGPVINCFGEVIGFRFHNDRRPFTPFLPTNVILRWWSYLMKFGEFRRPWLGMEIRNLHAVDFNIWEKFQAISTGVFVTKVEDDSPAKSANIHCNEFIVQCDGVDVRSVSEFFERIWEKVRDDSVVELRIVRLHKSRESRVVHRTRTLRIQETIVDNFYRWDLPRWTYKNCA